MKMFLKLCKSSEGVFKREFRKQFSTTLSVIIITLCHGIGLGWLSPMLTKLQSPENSPLDFYITVEQASWVGGLISIGGMTGNLIFGILLNRVGRKTSIFMLAIPHSFLWILLYFANSVEFLYAARICAGITGGGVFVVTPIFIAEIADPTIRGRLTSLFLLAYNIGITVGFIISTHLPYHLIPCLAITLPMLYLVLTTLYPETPQHLLRHGREAEAEQSLKYYRNYRNTTKQEVQQFDAYFLELKDAIKLQQKQNDDVGIKDFFTKKSLKALFMGILLMMLNIFSGSFALINYMSLIFATAKTTMDPDTNTIIIGVVQIVGSYMATIMVDRYGRKILMIVSTAGMGIGLALFGMYAYFAEETTVDLSYYSGWLPLLLMSFIIFIANVGVIAVTFVLLVEIMPARIRSQAASMCLFLLSLFAFMLLKMFPIFMHVFGLSATMWFCASVCALGLFYLTICLKETKGKSMDKDDADN